MAKIRVGLLFGGRSGEHEVSINSAQAIATAPVLLLLIIVIIDPCY